MSPLIPLECRYDGPIPPDDPAHVPVLSAWRRGRLFERLGRESAARLAAARRRLPGRQVAVDDGLRVLSDEVRLCRRHAAAWHGAVQGYLRQAGRTAPGDTFPGAAALMPSGLNCDQPTML